MYELNRQTIIVTLEGRGHQGRVFTHEVRRPTLDELLVRERRVRYEFVPVSATEEELRVDDAEANAQLYDAIALRVTGYRRDARETVELTPELLARIPVEHKSAVVRALYQVESELEADDPIDYFADEAGATLRVRQKLAGGEQIVHVLRHPTEGERRRYRTQGVRVLQSRRKGGRTAVTTNLRVALELYDALFERIEGATLDGRPADTADRALVLASIDPPFKAAALVAALDAYEADLRD